MAKNTEHKRILVFAHWSELESPLEMGVLHASRGRGKEIFSFEYSQEWLQSEHALVLDPELGLYSGPQYVHDEKANFGLFLDSSPDRWGRAYEKKGGDTGKKPKKRSGINFLSALFQWIPAIFAWSPPALNG